MTEVAEVTEVLPALVEAKVAELQPLDGESQALAVTALLSQSRTGLLTAIAAQDLPRIVEWKAKGAAIREIAKQLQLGKDMQLDAAEFVRRAERGIGTAIRDGQAKGEVRRNGQAGGTPTPGVRGSLSSSSNVEELDRLSSPTDFASNNELHGQGGGQGIYAMTDDVSDENFDEAITEAREENNLSRANVARKAKARAKPDVPQPVVPSAPKKTRAARKMMDDLVLTINSLVFIVNDTNPAEVDGEHHKDDITDTLHGLTVIRQFLNKVGA